jgi:Uma2 family endonuclease
MSAVKKLHLVSVEEYLSDELATPIKHEYLGGIVYKRPETRNAHNIIAGNILGTLHARLRGRPCRPYNSDTKVRIRLTTHTRFYYPDTSVVCRPNPQTDSFQDEPAVSFEVLSRSTRRTDEGEKKDAYLQIPSLCAYVLVEPEMPALVVFRRTENGFVREVIEGLDATLPLREINTDLPLAEIYEGVEFTPEVDEGADA